MTLSQFLVDYRHIQALMAARKFWQAEALLSSLAVLLRQSVGNGQTAESAPERTAEESGDAGFDPSQALCLVVLAQGVCSFELGDMHAAMHSFQEALALAQACNDLRRIGSVLHEMAAVAQTWNDPAAGVQLEEGAVRATTQAGGEAVASLLGLAVAYQLVGQPEKAIPVLLLLRESCEARFDLEGLGKCLHELSVAASQQGKGAEAIGFLVQAMRVRGLGGDAEGVAKSRAWLEECLRRHPECRGHPLLDNLFPSL